MLDVWRLEMFQRNADIVRVGDFWEKRMALHWFSTRMKFARKGDILLTDYELDIFACELIILGDEHTPSCKQGRDTVSSNASDVELKCGDTWIKR
jgi:hypothetical protein